MKLHLLDIPAESDKLAAWIEQHLVSESFGSFVVQLQAVHDSSNSDSATNPFPSLELSQILGDQQGQVIEHGLANCSQTQIQQLLSNPQAMVELQSQVFERGFPYWFDSVVPMQNAEATGASAGSTQRLNKLAATIRSAGDLPGQSVDHLDRPTSASQSVGSSAAPDRRTFNWNLLAMAAAVLIIGAVAFNLMSPPSTQSLAKWGWLSDDGIPTTGAPVDYLAKISAGGSAWFDEVPLNSDDYIQRLNELKAGCQALIDADHSLLATADQQWLIGKCMAWRSSFEKQLESVENDPQGFQEYLNETNETVDSLIEALDQRSNSV